MNESAATTPDAIYPIALIAKAAGVTSRTLRHYDRIGLLRPEHVGPNGQRFYTGIQLVRLQRVLLLKQLGLQLETIAEILDEQRDELAALTTHKEQLFAQRDAITRQIAALEHSISALTEGKTMELNKSFDGFNEQYKKEVTERWGANAYNASTRWWRAKDQTEQTSFLEQVRELNTAWIQAGKAGISAESTEAQQLAARHISWLSSAPGTPLSSPKQHERQSYICGLAEMYVADERFAQNYGGYAILVRDALKIYSEDNPLGH